MADSVKNPSDTTSKQARSIEQQQPAAAQTSKSSRAPATASPIEIAAEVMAAATTIAEKTATAAAAAARGGAQMAMGLSGMRPTTSETQSERTGAGTGAGAKTETGSERPRFPFGIDMGTADALFSAWEKRTSDYFERLMRNPTFLNAMGGMMNAGYKNKIIVDKTLSALWKNLNLPNKRDQERTLHLLNELHSRIFDLEERLEKIHGGAVSPDHSDGTSKDGEKDAARRTRPSTKGSTRGA